ncbi:Chloroperoxidase, partial [Glomus cerebriforme]
MENHEYQAPGPNDARSTCPGINVLANHGYLPRNGKDITPHQFIEAIYNGYNLTKVVGFILAHVGFYLVGKTWEGKVSLEDFSNSHDIVEHPMSLIRPDIGVGEGGKDYRKISPELLDSLFSEKNENDKLTRMSFAKQHIKRRDESLRDNPSFHGLSFFRKIQIFG